MPNAHLTSIQSSAHTITLRGAIAAPVRVTVLESQPFDLATRPPITSLDLPSGEFSLSIPRFDGARDRLYQRFDLAVGTGNTDLASGVCYVTGLPAALADYPYPSSPTIKGLQVNMIEDALRLGVGHAALNLNLGTILRPGPGPDMIPYAMDGKTYYFDGAYLAKFDERVKTLSDHGIVVTLILLNALRWDNVDIHPELRKALVHPGYHSVDDFTSISAFNLTNTESLDIYKAFIEFVAARYTRPDQAFGRACGYIIGNEVDSQFMWGNAGEMPVEQYVREYSLAMRTAFYAARKQYAQARVYVSLDHLWTRAFQHKPLRWYKGRDILDGLNAIFTAEGNFDWSLAYHPYPEDLAHADFWHDKTATRSFDTKRITFKNIEILGQYLAQPHYLYEGKLRHIILSEQGFHSDENAESEKLQAAAYAYAFWKVSHIPAIDSFILHAHVDNRDEFNLNLGIWRRDKNSPSGNAPGTPKPVYEVFKGIDGPECEKFFEEAKQVVGKRNWK
jgi:hypothetical protein